MIEQVYTKYLSRLLLTFSDLCDTDQEIANCLTLMRITPPANELQWTAEVVRRQIPKAYATVCYSSDYAATVNPQVLSYCQAVANYVRKDAP